MLTFDDAKLLLGKLRERTADEPCEVKAVDKQIEEGYELHLLTPGYDISPGTMTALHREGPFGLRHIGRVQGHGSRHLWILLPKE